MREVPEGYVEVGGVHRPKSDVEPIRRENVEPTAGFRPPPPGTVPAVSVTSNANTRSVAEAFQQPDLAHRLTSMLSAPDFDPEAYKQDPEAYLSTVEPGRVWQSAQPNADIVPIVRKSAYINEILQGEQVNLEVNVSPGMPVTFMSPKLGQFENQLSVISVRADEEGIARTTFRATPGTRGEIEIFASSPVHSGNARFLVKVRLPRNSSSPEPTPADSR